MRFATPPGHQAQVDFADFRLPWGKRYALLLVLGYSRLLWLRFFARKDMAALLAGLEQAFAFFGGVPRELLFDQMRSVITKDERLDGRRLVHNAEFLRFSVHWSFTPRACRPYRAKTKGKVERPVSSSPTACPGHPHPLCAHGEHASWTMLRHILNAQQ